jgi:hypothetical protein
VVNARPCARAQQQQRAVSAQGDGQSKARGAGYQGVLDIKVCVLQVPVHSPGAEDPPDHSTHRPVRVHRGCLHHRARIQHHLATALHHRAHAAAKLRFPCVLAIHHHLRLFGAGHCHGCCSIPASLLRCSLDASGKTCCCRCCWRGLLRGCQGQPGGQQEAPAAPVEVTCWGGTAAALPAAALPAHAAATSVHLGASPRQEPPGAADPPAPA